MFRKRMLGGFSLALLLSAANVLGAGADTRLADAAMQGDRTLVRSLVDQKVDVNGAQGDGMTALHWAAYKNDLEAAQLLIQHGANVNTVTRIGALTPLLMAARTGSAKMIAILVAAGASVNQPNAEGTTALMMAAASGSADAVRVLLDHGADVNARELAHGQTAAMFAAALNRDAVLKVLAAHGADLSVTTKVSELTRIRVAADGSTSIVDPKKAPSQTEEKANSNILAVPRDLGTTIMGGMTALLFATRDGHDAATRALLDAGAGINEVSAGDQTSPLVMAILNGHFDLAKYLLEHGADVNAANAAGLAPLYAAVDVQWAPHSWYPQPDTTQQKVSYLDLMQLLVDHGANVNARLGKKLWYRGLAQDGEWIDPAGSTAFWRAAKADDLKAMRFLVTHGADPNMATLQGDTPLIVATGFGSEANYSSNALESWLDAVKYCVDLGADVNAKDFRGYTPLHGAAYIGDNEMIKYLISKGADPKTRAKVRLDENRGAAMASDGKGDTVADMANGPRERSFVHKDTIALLEKLGSENSHNCRSSECVVPTKGDKSPVGSVTVQTNSAKPPQR